MLGEASSFEAVRDDILLQQEQIQKGFMELETLQKYVSDNKNNSMFIAKYAKRKELWMPDKLRITKRGRTHDRKELHEPKRR